MCFLLESIHDKTVWNNDVWIIPTQNEEPVCKGIQLSDNP